MTSSPVSHYNPQLRRALMQRIHLSAPPPVPLQHQVRGTSGVWTCKISWNIVELEVSHVSCIILWREKFPPVIPLGAKFLLPGASWPVLQKAWNSWNSQEVLLHGDPVNQRIQLGLQTQYFFQTLLFLALPESPFLKSRGWQFLLRSLQHAFFSNCMSSLRIAENSHRSRWNHLEWPMIWEIRPFDILWTKVFLPRSLDAMARQHHEAMISGIGLRRVFHLLQPSTLDHKWRW